MGTVTGTSIGGGYKPVVGPDGKVRLAKREGFGLSVSQRIVKRKKAKQPKVKRGKS